jgi:hypothetical protein
VAAVSLLAFGCTPPARVSDGWAVAAGTQGGAFVDHGKPTEGKPLVSTAARKAPCLREAELLGLLGDRCDHESENRPPAQPAGDLSPGIPEQTPQVRWYCGGKLVVRIVLAACDASGPGSQDGVTPIEVAVVTKHAP